MQIARTLELSSVGITLAVALLLASANFTLALQAPPNLGRNAGIGPKSEDKSTLEITITVGTQTHSGKVWAALLMIEAVNYVMCLNVKSQIGYGVYSLWNISHTRWTLVTNENAVFTFYVLLSLTTKFFLFSC